MKLPSFKKKYRILQITKGDGKSLFYPQFRTWYYIWEPIMDPEHRHTAYETFIHEDATDFLYKLQMKELSKKIIKKEAHPFNLVFEKLKRTETQDNE